MKTAYQRQYDRLQDSIMSKVETLQSLVDAHSQSERITEQHVTDMVNVEAQLEALINLLGGVESLS